MRRFLAIIGISLLVPAAAAAATLMGKDHVEVTVPVTDDLYAAGEEISITEKVNGDAILVGGRVDVTGNVREDLIAAGRTMTIAGAIGDDARIAGINVTLKSAVAGDLLIAGGEVTIEEDAVISGDAIIMGGTVHLNGTVKGDVRIYGGTIDFQGRIQGSLTAKSEEMVLNGAVGSTSSITGEKILIGSQASFKKDVTYWTSAKEMDFGTSLKKSATATFAPSLATLRPPEPRTIAGFFAGALGFFSLYSLLSGALLILFLVLITRKSFDSMAKRMAANPGKNAVIGLLYFLLGPVISIILAMTFIGLPLGLFTLFLYIASVFFAPIVTAMVFAKLLEYKNGWQWNRTTFFFASFLALGLFKLLTFVPVVGWIMKAVLVTMAFGALVGYKWEIVKKYG